MSQLNIHMTATLEHDLQKFMKVRHLNSKAEAIRTAIKESLERSFPKANAVDFSSWKGLAKKIPTNENPKFDSDQDLWK